MKAKKVEKKLNKSKNKATTAGVQVRDVTKPPTTATVWVRHETKPPRTIQVQVREVTKPPRTMQVQVRNETKIVKAYGMAVGPAKTLLKYKVKVNKAGKIIGML